MDASAPVPPIRAQKPTWSKAAQLAPEWELNRLGDRLSLLADTHAEVGQKSATVAKRTFAQRREISASVPKPTSAAHVERWAVQTQPGF